MGTRSLTHIKQDRRDSPVLCTIYQQFDGYPQGVGRDIQEALANCQIVNGFSSLEPRESQINGCGDLAATLVMRLKSKSESLYIKPASSSDMGEEYVYTLWCSGDEEYFGCPVGDICIECRSVYGGAILYSGILSEWVIPELA